MKREAKQLRKAITRFVEAGRTEGIEPEEIAQLVAIELSTAVRSAMETAHAAPSGEAKPQLWVP